MPSPLNVNDLEIVGYADVLKENMLPSVVPPVFRLKADPQRAFVPPYSLHAGLLFDATEVLQPELLELRDSREITLFDQPFPAARGFELWVDQSFEQHYEPLYEARHNLDTICLGAIAKAEEALRAGDIAGAERLSSVAVSANDRRPESLAIKAAIRRLNKNPGGEGLMAELALPILGEHSFLRQTNYYAGLFREKFAQPLKPASERPPMRGMACFHAE